MSGVAMEALHSCGCCLRRASSEDPTSSHTRKDMDIYWTMLKDCFNIHVTGHSRECGICQECVHRLADASDFKQQVVRSQEALNALQARTAPAMQIVSDIKVDVVIKEEPEEACSSAVPHDEEPPAAVGALHVQNTFPGLERPWGHGALDMPSEHFLLSGEPDATATSPLELDTEQDIDNKKNSCNICGKSFSFVGSLRRHLRLHTGEKLYACQVCDKSFSQSCHLQEHKLIHTGLKQYTCKKCNKNFRHKNSLKQHVKLHDTQGLSRPYICEVCNKDFPRLGALKTHERIHTGEKPYSCDICYKAFLLPEGLRRHKFTHTNEKPFVCEVCQKRFSDTGDLKRHMRTHTGEKPYSCEVCNRKFAQLSNLKQHTLIHSGDKPYACDVCQRRFTKSSHLKVHMKRHSKILDNVNPAVICKSECNIDEHDHNIVNPII